MNIKRYLQQDCTISKYLGQTPSGPSYDSSYAAKCRIEVTKNAIKGLNDSIEFIDTTKVFLAPTTANKSLTRKSKITIDGLDYIVEDIKKQYGFTLSHLECVVV